MPGPHDLPDDSGAVVTSPPAEVGGGLGGACRCRQLSIDPCCRGTCAPPADRSTDTKENAWLACRCVSSCDSRLRCGRGQSATFAANWRKASMPVGVSRQSLSQIQRGVAMRDAVAERSDVRELGGQRRVYHRVFSHALKAFGVGRSRRPNLRRKQCGGRCRQRLAGQPEGSWRGHPGGRGLTEHLEVDAAPALHPGYLLVEGGELGQDQIGVGHGLPASWIRRRRKCSAWRSKVGPKSAHSAAARARKRAISPGNASKRGRADSAICHLRRVDARSHPDQVDLAAGCQSERGLKGQVVELGGEREGQDRDVQIAVGARAAGGGGAEESGETDGRRLSA